MSSRSYSQFCGVAAAMDVLGERWAALVVRELLSGPQRYTDLLAGLPGISTDMLARRLTELEAAGVVTRAVLPPPAASKVYELTHLGLELQPVVRALARWGIRRLVAGDYDDSVVEPGWIELAVHSTFSVAHAPKRPLRVRFVVGDADFTVVAGRTGLRRVESDDSPADVEVHGAPRDLASLLVDPDLAQRLIVEGAVSLRGSADDVTAAVAAFRLRA